MAIGMFIYGFNFLKGKKLFSDRRDFYAIYDDIGGLYEANAVLFNGYRVGQVSDISLMPDATGRVVVRFFISDSQVKIPTDSYAKIISSDILGTKAVDISLGKSTTYAEDGDTLHSSVEASLSESVNAQVKPLKEKAESLILSIDSVMLAVQAVLNKDTRDNLGKSINNIQFTLENFSKISMRLDTLVKTEKQKLSSIFSKIELLTGMLSSNNENISAVLANLHTVSDSLAAANVKSTINNANVALLNASEVMAKINKGEGSLGLLVNNDSLYNNLDRSTAELEKLLNDLRMHPGRYVHFSIFGKKDK